MKKEHLNWKIRELVNNVDDIEFPEFQREPTVWKLEKKQRLIDSILREFDIASIYFFKRKDRKYDCIDGQQRINAIWSYIGINDADEDNKYHLKINNEIYNDGRNYQDVDQKRYNSLYKKWKEKILNYKLNIIVITDIDEEKELNLQFLRLQLGAPLNAGEKLHAMTGNMRDEIFHEISQLDFFNKINIPERRFAKEQVTAQILINVYSKVETSEFHRSRYIDLQEFFKEKDKFTNNDKILIRKIKNNLDLITKSFSNVLSYINNRAIAVSVYLFISELIETNKENEINKFKDFFILFLKTLKWQIPKGLDMDTEYRDLMNFQTNVTQAAGEKTAIQKRHNFWREYFYYYKKNNIIKGDKEYYKNNRLKPDIKRKHVRL